MTREITNRLDQMLEILTIIGRAVNATAEQSLTPPLKTNSPQDVSEPPENIHCSIETVSPLNLHVLQPMTNEQIANGDSVLTVAVGNTRYKGVLTADNTPGTTVLTRIPPTTR
jgi:hypothetical protein